MTTRRNLTLFDLDGTLLPHDSDHAFGEFMVRIGWADPVVFRARNDAFFADYQAGTLDVAAYVAYTTSVWRDRSPAEQAQAQAQFLAEEIAPHMRDNARALVRAHQAQGDLVAIVTATNEFITRPIADAFGVPDLLAVRLVRDTAGRCTGEIDGVPTFQAGKVQRVNDWLAAQGLSRADFETVSFYSDSPNDLPLLEWANDPVATNPTPALERIARERGWRILKLFE